MAPLGKNAVAREQVRGTARLSGVVVDERDSAVRRAIVTLNGGALTRSRSAVTDDEGRFEFTGLPAGQFSLSASRAAYVTSSYGSKAPGRPGTPLRVTDGQTIANLSIILARGAV